MTKPILQQASEELHSRGGRMTAQRRLILRTLESLSGHPTAEEIYSLARREDPNLNLSTVYRTLRWLEDAQMVNPRRFKDERGQERYDSASPTQHYHFRCEECGQIVEFDEPLVEQVRRHFERQSGCNVDEISLVLYGICGSCREEMD